jgi:prepilin-type N-terminal cleavage/methylation domain-containing protein
MKSSGFTLIELLVVVAIIMILAATILASLGGARNKSKDARVVAQMASIRNQAELFMISNSDYTGSGPDNVLYYCNSGVFGTADTDNASGLIADIESLVGPGRFACFISRDHWALTAHLVDGRIWCVDSEGRSKPGVNSDGVTPATQMSWAVYWSPEYRCF